MNPLSRKSELRLGTRASPLASAQAQWVQSRIEQQHPDTRVTLVPIKTTGDKIDFPLYTVGGKGLFVKEIEEALLRGEVDLAVHSAKDLPAVLPEGLTLFAFPAREDPRDVLISREGQGFKELPRGGKIGTTSLRRQAQLLHLRPDLQMVPLRGNLDTRIQKLFSLQLDALVLAYAGLRRLGWEERISDFFSPADMLPAIGQGVLAIEGRWGDERVGQAVSGLNHPPTQAAFAAERSFLRKLEGGCQVPIAGLAEVESDTILLTGMVASLDGTKIIQEKVQGPLSASEALGEQLAEILIARGAGEILLEVMRKK